MTYLHLLGPVLLCYSMMLFELMCVKFQDGENQGLLEGRHCDVGNQRIVKLGLI